MFGISGFFKNINNAFTKEIVLRTAVRDSIKKYANVDVALEDVDCKRAIVTLKKVNQAAFSTIFIKKQKILDEINNNQKIMIIKDLR